MGIPGSANPMLLGGAAGYEIQQSLRLNSADSAYLNRTPSSSGNRRTWTWSGWCKVGKPGESNYRSLMEAFTGGNDVYNTLTYQNGQFSVNQDNGAGGVMAVYTTGVYRDPSAWYHTVFSVDTTQATAANRVKIYINGVEVPVTNSVAPGQNLDTWINGAYAHRIGARWNGPNSASNFEGYLAEVHFIDGSALDPEDFGEFDDNGVWRPIKYAGSYTGNSFYLKFASGDGTDSSGLSNTWTANNFTTSGTGTDVMSDTPTTNWATINRLFTSYGSAVTDGNLILGPWSDNGWNRCVATISQNTGKWYFEVTANNSLVSNAYYNGIGVAVNPAFINSANYWGSSGTNVSYGGLLQSDEFAPSSNSTFGTSLTGSFSSGEVMQCAIDIDAGKLWFGIDNSWIGGGNPGSGTTPTYTITANAQYYFGAATFGSGRQSILNFGQRSFNSTPPSGFSPINTSTMPAPDIADGSQYFNTVLYTGNGSTQTISGVGFQPDWTWLKIRSQSYDHAVFDVIRGATKDLEPNTTGAEQTRQMLTAFTSDGFSVGNDTQANKNGDTFVAWNWKAGGSGSSNTAGSTTSTVSANPSAGFSIVSYTGNGTAGATIGHGLGVAPKMIMVKNRDDAAHWNVYHAGVDASSPEDYFLRLNSTDARIDSSLKWNDTAPTSSVFSVGSSGNVNSNTKDIIAYCFAEVEGYSKFGSYTGNGSTDGVFLYCGFKPALVITKRTSSTGSWQVYDTKRDPYNVAHNELVWNDSAAEVDTTTYRANDILSNGIKLRGSHQGFNASGNSYIFMAWAENPFGGDGVSPATAR